MNDDELSEREHDQMRARLLSGAKRIKPAGAHRTQILGGAVALVLVAIIAGGAMTTAGLFGSGRTEPAATVTPTPTVAPSEDPQPTPTSTSETTAPIADPRGMLAFGGDCANALDAEAVGAAVGTTMVLLAPRWVSGAEALQGGLVCTWTDPEAYMQPVVTLVSYPASVVPAEVRDAPARCGDDIGYCSIRGVSGSTWLMLGVSPNLARSVADGLWQDAAARAGEFGSPAPATRTEVWWDGPACADLFTGTDVLARTGYRSLQYLPDTFDDPTSPSTIPQRLGGVAQCMYGVVDRDGVETFLSVEVVPGGGAYFNGIAASERAAAIAVDGAEDAVSVLDDDLWEGYYPPIVATDGVNLLIVGVNVAEERKVDPAVVAVLLQALAG